MEMTNKNDVCIVVSPTMGSEYLYYIYIVDLSVLSDSKEVEVLGPQIPTLRIADTPKTLRHMAFAVIDSTLYMFGGLLKDDWKIESFSHSLQRGSHSVIRSPEDDMLSISNMRSRKKSPRAVVIGDQICLFPLIFKPGMVHVFEIYDPKTDRWLVVPSPPDFDFDSSDSEDIDDRNGYVRIVYYYVVDQEVL